MSRFWEEMWVFNLLICCVQNKPPLIMHSMFEDQLSITARMAATNNMKIYQYRKDISDNILLISYIYYLPAKKVCIPGGIILGSMGPVSPVKGSMPVYPGLMALFISASTKEFG